MKYLEFNTLNFKKKLEIIYHSAVEIDNIFPWFGNLRIVRIYKLQDFLIELEYDLKAKEFTRINAFNSFDYLEKYAHHFDKMKNKINSLLND